MPSCSRGCCSTGRGCGRRPQHVQQRPRHAQRCSMRISTACSVRAEAVQVRSLTAASLATPSTPKLSTPVVHGKRSGRGDSAAAVAAAAAAAKAAAAASAAAAAVAAAPAAPAATAATAASYVNTPRHHTVGDDVHAIAAGRHQKLLDSEGNQGEQRLRNDKQGVGGCGCGLRLG